MSSSACTLHLFSLTTNSLSISSSKAGAPASPSLPSLLSPSVIKLPLKSISLCSLFRAVDAVPSRFVGNLAISSDVEQDEEVLSVEERPSFSADLKLFVGNLPYNVDSATLAWLFGQAGNVEVVEVIYDKLTGRSRGFAFVTMSTAEEAEAAAQQFNGYELEGRALRVNAGPPPARREESSFRGSRSGASFDSTNRLYVGNLAWGVDDLALENLFSEQGKVMEARVVYDRDSGRSKGFGFVTYSSAKEVNNAIESLNGIDLNGRSIRVSMAESRPRRQF